MIVKKSLNGKKMYKCRLCGAETPVAYKVVLKSVSGVKFMGVVCYRCRKRLEIDDRKCELEDLLEILRTLKDSVENQLSMKKTYPIVMFTRNGGHIVWLARRFREMGFVVVKNSHVGLELTKGDIPRIDEVMDELRDEIDRLERLKECVG